MYLHEQIALRLAKERLADTMRAAEQLRARRRARPAWRIRLGRRLVRLGHWMVGHRSPVAYDGRRAPEVP
jgi:hypothetical protein